MPKIKWSEDDVTRAFEEALAGSMPGHPEPNSGLSEFEKRLQAIAAEHRKRLEEGAL